MRARVVVTLLVVFRLLFPTFTWGGFEVEDEDACSCDFQFGEMSENEVSCILALCSNSEYYSDLLKRAMEAELPLEGAEGKKDVLVGDIIFLLELRADCSFVPTLESYLASRRVNHDNLRIVLEALRYLAVCDADSAIQLNLYYLGSKDFYLLRDRAHQNLVELDADGQKLALELHCATYPDDKSCGGGEKPGKIQKVQSP